MSFTVVSTFSGCGGSCLGYKMAGGKLLLAVEWDDNAVATYKANFPDVDVFHGDIAKLSVEEVLKRTGLKPGELDIFDGSPPCQGFSTAGKREFSDSRNQLFKEYVRLLKGLQPKTFVMENVSGMVKGQMKIIFAEILKDLKQAGYKVSARLLNAMHYGVPQSRERMIFIGVREDLSVEPCHPSGSSRTISIEESCRNVDHRTMPPPFREFNRKVWNKQKHGENGYLSSTGKDSGFNHVRVHPKKPCPTIPKSCVFGGFSGLTHWDEPRSLSIGELMRATSFPDNYIFLGNYEDAHNRIGNCVPPKLMYAVSKHIYENILSKIL